MFGPGDAKEDWAILRALSAHVGEALPYDNLNQLRGALYAQYPHFADIEAPAQEDAKAIEKLAKVSAKIKKKQRFQRQSTISTSPTRLHERLLLWRNVRSWLLVA